MTFSQKRNETKCLICPSPFKTPCLDAPFVATAHALAFRSTFVYWGGFTGAGSTDEDCFGISWFLHAAGAIKILEDTSVFTPVHSFSRAPMLRLQYISDFGFLRLKDSVHRSTAKDAPASRIYESNVEGHCGINNPLQLRRGNKLLPTW